MSRYSGLRVEWVRMWVLNRTWGCNQEGWLLVHEEGIDDVGKMGWRCLYSHCIHRSIRRDCITLFVDQSIILCLISSLTPFLFSPAGLQLPGGTWVCSWSVRATCPQWLKTSVCLTPLDMTSFSDMFDLFADRGCTWVHTPTFKPSADSLPDLRFAHGVVSSFQTAPVGEP